MKKYHILGMLLLAGSLIAGDDDFLRTGTFSAGRMTSDPVIDGRVSNRKYFEANRYSGLINSVQQPGLALKEPVDWYLGYTDQAFYLAFQIHRPKGAPVPLTRTDGAGKQYPQEVFGDDCLEAMFDIGTEAFDLALNSKGDYSVYRIRPNDRYSYRPKLQYSARVTEWGWEGELRLAFADFGLKAPSPETVWRFDLILNEKTPFERIAGVVGMTDMNQWMEPGRFAHLKFAPPNTPAIHITRAGAYGSYGGIDLRVLPTGEKATVELELFRDRYSTNFFEIADGECRENRALTPGAAARLVLKNFYERIEHETGGIETGVAPLRFELFRPLKPGRYLATWKVLTANKKALTAGALPFVVVPPISVETRAHYLSDDLCEVDVDLQGMDSPKGLVTARFKSNNEIVAEQAKTIDRKGTLFLSTARIPPDSQYELEVTVGENQEQMLKVPMKRPAAPEWFANSIGKSDRIPAPWTPVSRDGELISVTERTYDFQDSFLPARISAADEELLAAPPAVMMEFTDGTIVRMNHGKNEFLNESPGKLAWRFQSVDGFLKGQSELEYDGFLWCDFILTPDKTRKIKRLWLEIPLRRENAEFFNHTYTGMEPFRFRDLGNWDRLADGLHKLKFAYGLWIGGYERGLTLALESDQNTDGGNQTGFYELDADRDMVKIRMNLITKERKLTAPVSFSFGLQATPVRPATRRTWFDTICNYSAPRPWNDEQKFDAWSKLVFGAVNRMGGNWGIFWSNPGALFGHSDLMKADRENLKRAAAASAEHHIPAIYYSGWAANSGAQELEGFIYDAVRLPLGNWMGGWGNNLYKQCPQSQWTDMYLYNIQRLVDECGIRGVYMDQTSELSSCMNTHHNCGYTAADGSIRPTFPVRAMRNLHKRLYQMLEEKFGPNGFLIYAHNSSQPVFTPVDAFISRRCYAETFAHKPTTLAEVFSFDRVAAGYNPSATGIASEITWWNGFHPSISNNNAMAVVSLFGGGIKGVVMHYLNLGAKRYGFSGKFHEGYGYDEHAELALSRVRNTLKSAEFIPFFKSGKLVSPADKRLKSALYLEEKQALIIVSNVFNNEVITSKIELNLPFQINSATDPLSGEAVDLNRVSVEKDSYFLISVKE